MLETGHSVKVGHGSFYAGAIAIFLCESLFFLPLSASGETKRLGIIADGATLLITFDRTFRLSAARVADAFVEVNCCAALLAALLFYGELLLMTGNDLVSAADRKISQSRGVFFSSHGGRDHGYSQLFGFLYIVVAAIQGVRQ